jgi:hypothetical protein
MIVISVSFVLFGVGADVWLYSPPSPPLFWKIRVTFNDHGGKIWNNWQLSRGDGRLTFLSGFFRDDTPEGFIPDADNLTGRGLIDLDLEGPGALKNPDGRQALAKALHLKPSDILEVEVLQDPWSVRVLVRILSHLPLLLAIILVGVLWSAFAATVWIARGFRRDTPAA